jgi:transposase
MHTFITSAQFDFIKPFLPSVKITRPRKYSDYDLLNGLLYVIKTGCQWRNIPHKYPPWRSVYWFWTKLQDYSCLDKVLNQTFEKLHDRDTKLYNKHILITDSQSIDAAEYLSSDQRGYDGNKKRNGLKRFVLCDTLGSICGVFSVTANSDEKRSLRSYLLSQKSRNWSRTTLIADKGFESGKLQRELFQKLNLSFAPMKRKKKYKNSEYTKELIEKEEIERKKFNTWIKSMRYAVEPVFSWFNKYRRLVRCFERTANCHTNFCKLAAIHLGLKRF